MAKTYQAPISQNIINPAVTIVNATSFIATNPGTAPTNTVLFATAGANDSVLKSVMIGSDDTSARTVAFYLSKDSGTTNYLLFTILVPLSSGANGTAANIDVLAHATLTVGLPLDQTGRPVLPLVAAARIYVGVITAAVTASKTVYVVGVQEDF